MGKNAKIFTAAPGRPGQMAISLVITVLLFLLLMFPVIDMFVRNESKWSVKEKQSSTAFHLAEAGVDRARWKLLENTDYWVMTGTGTMAGYNFDQVYTAETGGTYTIKISSDPVDSDKRVVESAGRDPTTNEVRRIKAVIVNDNVAEFATRAVKAVSNGAGATHIHWGPVMSGTSIDAKNRTYPRFFSAGHVDPQDGGSTVASTDNLYWWSYYTLPPLPEVKFANYLSSATDSDTLYGGAPNGCGRTTGATYHNSDATITFKSCQDTSGRTYYLDGANTSVTFESGGAGNYIVGNVIVTNGNVTVKGGGGAKEDYNTPLPPEAWKEYGGDWDYYHDEFDATYDDYADAEAASYQASGINYYLENVLLHGFLYVGKNFYLSGGGSARLHGVLMVNGSADLASSTFDVFYDPEVSSDIMLQGLNLKLHSWYEVKGEWPSVP